MTEQGRRARREYGLGLVLLAGGGALLLVSFALSWATVSVPLLAGSDAMGRDQSFTGHDLFPAAGMAGWVVLAGLGGIVATRSWGRVLVAVLCALAGLAAAVVAVSFAFQPGVAVDHAMAGLGRTAVEAPATTTLAWLLACLAGLEVAATGGWAAVRGPHWPRLGSRYERTPRTRRSASAWEAQDMGHDPSDDLVE